MIKTILLAIWITYTIMVTIELVKLFENSKKVYFMFKSYVEIQDTLMKNEKLKNTKEYKSIKKEYEEIHKELHKTFENDNL